MNELLLLISVAVIFGSVLAAYRLFGNAGLYCMSAVTTVLANIEVLILVDAFGLEQTLGNVLFASTFLITDILSENTSSHAARKAVYMGMGISAFFVLVSQSWMLYRPSENDWVMPSIRVVFSSSVRTVVASMLAYAVSQLADVWLYHRWWDITTKRTGRRRARLWLRNNGSTLISQVINTVLFTLGAFAGREGYDGKLLLDIMLSSYVVYIFTSLLDTPFVYWARRIHDRHPDNQ